jgi:predicted DNA-binding transcriptional regulator AlpA
LQLSLGMDSPSARPSQRAARATPGPEARTEPARSNGTTTGIDRILSTRDVVAITKHHRATLHRWIRAGKFPPRHTVQGLILGWRESDITSWLAGSWKPAR